MHTDQMQSNRSGMGSKEMPVAEVTHDFPRFKQYTRAKHTIAYEIRTLAEFLRTRLGEREAEECRQLMVKLAEDRFVLAVVGQFKRGKSSLMNAIIGRDLLPTGVLPLTSAVTVLKYGPKERLTITKEGATYPEEVPLSSLAEYVTEKGNPGNKKKVACACLELPLPFLRRGLEFVDTPGIGSAIEANTATTYGFLPRSDAVIFVTSVESPLTRAETDFLESIRGHVRKIFFVVNKIDFVGEKEQQEILHFISEALKHRTGAENVRIFPLSSTLGLTTLLAGKEESYAQSGVKALQEALSSFLSSEKGNVLLVSVLDKLLRLATEAEREMSLLKAAGETSLAEMQDRTAALKERFQVLRDARREILREIQERTIGWVKKRVSARAGSFLAVEAHTLLEDLDKALALPRWRLSRSAANDFREHALTRFTRDLDLWVKEQTESLNRELSEILRVEWRAIEQQLHRIPVEAAEVLGVSGGAGDRYEGGDPNLPIHGVLTQPGFKDLQWRSMLPMFQGCLPVLMMRSSLKKRLGSEILGFLEPCARHFNGAFEERIREVLKRVGSETENRAAELESRFVQAMKGKRLAKGIDGHWQLTELDSAVLSREIEMLTGIERKLISIQSEMLEPQTVSGTGNFPEASVEPLPPTIQPEMESPPPEVKVKPADKTGIAGDLSTRGCPVCNRMVHASSHFLAHWQYAIAIREDAQRMHALSLGFCPLHTWQLAAVASPQGISQGYPGVMERLSTELFRMAEGTSEVQKTVRGLVQDSRHCRVCSLMRETETAYLKDFAAFVQTPEGQSMYRHSQGVCLRHLGLLTAILPSKELVRFLLEHAAQRFSEISEDMQSFTLKRDALHGYAQNLDERDAYLRGLVFSAGARKVCFPAEFDAESRDEL